MMVGTDDDNPLQTRAPDASLKERLKSLDAYRGLIMITLAFGGFGLAQTATLQLQSNLDSGFWKVMRLLCFFGHWGKTAV